MDLSPEIIQMIIQGGGAPAAFGLVLYYAWRNGPKAELHRMSDTVREVAQELRAHREAMSAEQSMQRERIQRLEILMDHTAEKLLDLRPTPTVHSPKRNGDYDG